MFKVALFIIVSSLYLILCGCTTVETRDFKVTTVGNASVNLCRTAEPLRIYDLAPDSNSPDLLVPNAPKEDSKVDEVALFGGDDSSVKDPTECVQVKSDGWAGWESFTAVMIFSPIIAPLLTGIAMLF